MKLTPQISLSFNGQCQAAFEYYEQHLNGAIAFMMTWGESPLADLAPPEWRDKIAHATLNIGEVSLAGSDPLPALYERPQGFSVMLQMNDPGAAERVFDALAEGGAIHVPLQETFWAARYGTVVDRFGVPWTINCEAVSESVS